MKYSILLLFLFTVLSLNSGSYISDAHKVSNAMEMYIESKQEEQRQREFIARQNLTIMIIARIESHFNSSAYNPNENAAGLLQTRPIMVAEINRLLGSNIYSLSDRWSIEKSIEMFISYQSIVNPEWCFEKSARLWNGGITGMNKSSTDVYWNLFSSYLLDAEYK